MMNRNIVKTLVGKGETVWACKFAGDENTVIATSSTKLVKWDVTTGLPLATFEGHTADVNACAVSPDGKTVVSASSDLHLKLWDVETAKETGNLIGHSQTVLTCAFSSDGKLVASGAADKNVKIWDVATKTELLSIPAHTDRVMGCAISPDNTMVASSAQDQLVMIWDVATGRQLAKLAGHKGAVRACAFSPDGRFLASVSIDCTVILWDVKAGIKRRTLSCGNQTLCCVFSPNGNFLVVVTHETLIVWDVEKCTQVVSLNGHTGWIFSCDISPDGRYAVTAGQDKNVIVWDIDEYSKVKFIKEFATEIPEFDAHNVQRVLLRSHYFVDVPDVLYRCNKLETLDLSGGALKSFNDANIIFPMLKYLDLHANYISQISFSVAVYPSLKFIDITENPFTNFPDSIFALPTLESLKAGGVSLPTGRQWDKISLQQWTKERKFSDITCQKLEHAFNTADTSGDGVINDSEFHEFCTLARKVLLLFPQLPCKNVLCHNLTSIQLSWLGLTEVPPFFQEFAKLTYINLEGNNITNLPSYMGAFSGIKEIQVAQNPDIKTPPIEVVQLGGSDVADYMKLLIKGSVKCLKTKLMVVGLGGVGKTSLLKALEKETFLNDGPSTDGIDIHDWKLDDVEFCTWDFAGQTIYYNTHQMFLSTRAIYVVVWNVRLGIEHAGLDFWLYSIQTRAPKCPVLVVGTRTDEVPYEDAYIPEKTLKKKYPQIQGFFGVSNKQSDGIDKFRDELVRIAKSEPYMGEAIPTPYIWLERIIKKKDTPPAVTKEQLIKLAAPTNIPVEQLESVLQFLNDTGVIYFSRECYMQDFIVLNPQWITKVLACVVTAQKHNYVVKGVFHKEDISKIWSSYPSEYHLKLLILTVLFELAFELREGKYVVPCMLPENDPDAMALVNDSHHTKYSYRTYSTEYLPPGLFNRLQVKMQHYIEGEGHMWKSGVVLKTKTHVAVGEMQAGSESWIKITVYGENPKNLLDVFHNALQELLIKSFSGLHLKLTIPCETCLVEPDTESIGEFSTSMLRKCQNKGVGFIVCSNGHSNSLANLFSSLPPAIPTEYANQQADIISDISTIRTAVEQPLSHNETQIFVSFNPLNSGNSKAPQIGPVNVMDIVKCLKQQKYRVEHTQGSPQHSAESVQACQLFIACVSDEYTVDSNCISEFLYAIKVLKKQFIPVLVGAESPSRTWNMSQIGLVMAGELYIDCQRSLQQTELLNRVANFLAPLTSPQKAITTPASFDCFVSYCWRNSKSYNNDEKLAGYADPREIAAELKKENLSVWLDINELGGQGLFLDIAKGLKSTKVVVACISEDYSKSDNCAMELRHATKNLRKPVIVVAVGTKGPLTWCRSEVSTFIKGCTMIGMGNKTEYEKNLPRLINEVKKTISEIPTTQSAIGTSASVEHLVENIQDKIEGLQHAFLMQTLSADQDILFPRVFSCWWNNMDAVQSEAAVEKQQIRFLCEHPGAWHFVKGQKIFEVRSPLFASSVAAYLVPLAEILQQSSICDPSLYLHDMAKNQQQLGTSNKQFAVTKLKSVFKDTLGASQGDVEKILQLKRVVLPTGEVQWLCDAHHVYKKK